MKGKEVTGDHELRASAACPVCGMDTPHGHYNEDAEIALVARPTFEFFVRSWLHVYLPDKRMRRGESLGALNWTVRSKQSPPDYICPVIESLWGFWLDAWMSKPSWCNAYDTIAMEKQIERQSARESDAY